MSMKNSNRTRDLPACSAVPQSTAPPHAPIPIFLTECLYLYLYLIAGSLYDKQLRNVIIKDMFLINFSYLNEDITKCLDTYCNTNLNVSTTAFITQGNT